MQRIKDMLTKMDGYKSYSLLGILAVVFVLAQNGVFGEAAVQTALDFWKSLGELGVLGAIRHAIGRKAS